MKFLLQELAAAAGGELGELWHDGSLLKDPQLTVEREFSFSIDSRTIHPGQVFIALQGDKTNGHEHLEHALQQGTCGLIVSDVDRVSAIDREILSPKKTGVPSSSQPFVIKVNNTLLALQSIARACRQKHPIPLVGITGSNGKTTVKDMTASILKIRYDEHVLKSEKSFNNHIGLPLTLANMSEHHQVAVVEMGMNAPGEIRCLVGIAKPKIGVVTNIAQAHAEFFDSIESIMWAKMELIESLPRNGTAILNKDDKLFPEMLRFLKRCSLVTFGIRSVPNNPNNPFITAKNIVASKDAHYSFILKTLRESIPVSLNIPGYHNVSNALAATAITSALYASELRDYIEEVEEGLKRFQPGPMRMQMIKHQNVTIVNDAYNANPTSMASALQTLKTFSCRGKKIAVLGDMFELGMISRSVHYEVGKLAAEVPVDRLFLLGEYASDVSQGALDAGMSAALIIIGDSHKHLSSELANHIQEGDIVLIKASRGMTMEKVTEQLLQCLK